jgi:RNA-directed DNA polymerase
MAASPVAVWLKHWRRGPTTYPERRALGASVHVAQILAGNTRRWRHNAKGLNRVLTVAHFDRLGVPRLC